LIGQKMSEQIGTSPLRFWCLFIWIVFACAQNVACACLSPVVDEGQSFFHQDKGNINLLSSIPSGGFFMALLPSGWLLDKYGLQVACRINGIIYAFGAAAIYYASHFRNYYALVLSQSLICLLGPLIMSIETFVNIWFPVKERALALAVAWQSQTLGTILAFLLAPQIVRTADDIELLLQIESIFSGFSSFLLIFTFPSRPAMHASKSSAVQKHEFWESIQKLLRHPTFLILSLAFGVSPALTQAWAILFDFYLGDKYADETLGYLNCTGMVTGSLSAILAGFLLDKYDINLKWGYHTGVFLQLLLIVLYFFIIYLDLDVMYIFLTVGCIGVISGMCTTAALELSVELTFPTSETVSSGFLNFTFNVSCGLFIFLGSYLTHYQYLFSLMACFALASLALFSVPNAHRRKLYDNAEPYRILN